MSLFNDPFEVSHNDSGEPLLWIGLTHNDQAICADAKGNITLAYLSEINTNWRNEDGNWFDLLDDPVHPLQED